MFAALVLAIQLVPASSAAGHAHGAAGAGDKCTAEHGCEWAGIFPTPESTYLWTAQKTKNGGIVKYADDTMKIAVLPASAASEAALDALEKEGVHSLNETCTKVVSGGVITPKEDHCYNLHFKKDWWQSLFTINATGQAALAFFAQHVPTEFENTDHYLKDDHGDDIEPVHQLPEKKATAAAATPHDSHEEKHWGAAIGTAIMVNIVTLVGVVFLVPGLSRAAKDYAAQFECLTSAFAAGAISACAFFLLLFESTHLVASGWTEEVDQIWRWGTMILGGALFPVCLQLLSEVISRYAQAKTTADSEKGETESISASTRVRIISGILIGDFVHNLVDGFFIGAAFKGCGSNFGWTVAGSTIAHEFAQELSDYVILTGKDCKLHPAMALGLNFASGTGVLLGVICVLSADIANADIGLLLAWGGGTYLYIAFVECMPKMHSAKVSALIRAVAIFTFIVGAVAIGLVLLDHEHCVPPPAPGAPPKAAGHGGHHH